MSIVNSNRHQARIPFRTSVPRTTAPSKRELAEMLANAAQKTAAMQDADGRVKPGHDEN